MRLLIAGIAVSVWAATASARLPGPPAPPVGKTTEYERILSLSPMGSGVGANVTEVNNQPVPSRWACRGDNPYEIEISSVYREPEAGRSCSLTVDRSLRWLGYLGSNLWWDIRQHIGGPAYPDDEPLTMAGAETCDAVPAKSPALRKLLSDDFQPSAVRRLRIEYRNAAVKPPEAYYLTVDAELPWVAAISWLWGKIHESATEADDNVLKTAVKRPPPNLWAFSGPLLGRRGYIAPAVRGCVLTADAHLVGLEYVPVEERAEIYRTAGDRPDPVHGNEHFLAGHGVGSNHWLGEKHPAPYEWACVPFCICDRREDSDASDHGELTIDGNLNWLSVFSPAVWRRIHRQIGARFDGASRGCACF